MQEKSVKNSIRSFGVVKSNKSNIMSASDASNLSLQLSRIGKMLDESVLKFEEGMKLSQECSKMLDEADKKITILLEKNGSVEEENFDA